MAHKQTVDIPEGTPLWNAISDNQMMDDGSEPLPTLSFSKKLMDKVDKIADDQYAHHLNHATGGYHNQQQRAGVTPQYDGGSSGKSNTSGGGNSGGTSGDKKKDKHGKTKGKQRGGGGQYSGLKGLFGPQGIGKYNPLPPTTTSGTTNPSSTSGSSTMVIFIVVAVAIGAYFLYHKLHKTHVEEKQMAAAGE